MGAPLVEVASARVTPLEGVRDEATAGAAVGVAAFLGVFPLRLLEGILSCDTAVVCGTAVVVDKVRGSIRDCNSRLYAFLLEVGPSAVLIS